MANLKYQFMSAIDDSFKEGRSKHAEKRSNNFETTYKIYSYTSMKNLKDFSSNFVGYIKENHSEIRKVSQIDSNIVNSFLDYKSSKCRQTTLDTYKSYLAKLSLILNHKFQSCETQWDIKKPISLLGYNQSRGVNAVMSLDSYNILITANSNSKVIPALMISKDTGMRIQEICELRIKDICFSTGKISGFKNTKGGKVLEDKQLTQMTLEKIKELAANKNDNEKLLGVEPDSMNKALNRLQDKYQLERRSFHSVRRLASQTLFDDLRANNIEKTKAISIVNKFLNHGEGRGSGLLAKSYITIY